MGTAEDELVVEFLGEALSLADDDCTRYHIREALQAVVARDHAEGDGAVSEWGRDGA